MAYKSWVSKGKCQAFEVQSGLVDSMHCVHAATVANALRAVVTRVVRYAESDGRLTSLPSVQSEAVSELRAFMHKTTRHAATFAPIPAAAYAACQTTARKKQRMVEAGNLLKRLALGKRDAEIRAFVKMEALKRGKPCRLIQPRDDKYLFECGRHVKPLEKGLYASINHELGYVAIAKGLNGTERAAQLWEAWSAFDDPIAFSLDFIKYDQHVRAEVLEAEHSVYCLHSTESRYLGELLSWQLLNKGRVVCADGVVKYKSDGGRMSGDPNTSLGNILVCLSGHLLYAREKGVNIRILNDGDDSVIVMDRRDAKRYQVGLEDWWLRLGFRLGIDKIVDEFERIDFCQCRPVSIDGVWCMVRNPATAIQKDLVNTGTFSSEEERCAWLRAVGLGGLSQYAGVPVFDAFYRGLVAAGRSSSKQYQWKAGLARSQKFRLTGLKAGAVLASSRVSFFLAFGIIPDEQRILELKFMAHHYGSSTPSQITTLGDHHNIYPSTDLLKGRSTESLTFA